MRILVIDDDPRNIASAHLTLEGHEVTACNTTQAAYWALREYEGELDAVLTDLFMPPDLAEPIMDVFNNTQWVRREIPVGLVSAIYASNMGIRVVICTDADRHQDPICTLLSFVLVLPGFARGGSEARVAYVESRNVPVRGLWDAEARSIVMDPEWRRAYQPRMKDWKLAMEKSGLFPELEAKDEAR